MYFKGYLDFFFCGVKTFLCIYAEYPRIKWKYLYNYAVLPVVRKTAAMLKVQFLYMLSEMYCDA